MAKTMEWAVDETTCVELHGKGIRAIQDFDMIFLSKTGTSPAPLINAILSAMTEAGYDMPDLSRHGYERKETRA